MSFEEFDDHTPEYQYEDDIPDLSDSEEEHEEEWKNEWRNFEMVCREANTTPFSAFGLHISKVNKELECGLRDLTDGLSLEDIKQLILLTQPKSNVMPTNTTSSIPKNSSVPPLESPKPVFGPQKPYSDVCTITLQKGLTALQIDKFILHINTTLEEKKDQIKEVQIIAKDWPQPYHAIPAAKKLHAKYLEAGLAGCLIFRGYKEAAHKLYCIAYEKAKIDVKTQNIIFHDIDNANFRQKIMQSADTFLGLLSSKGLSNPGVTKSVPVPSESLPKPGIVKSAPAPPPNSQSNSVSPVVAHHCDDDPNYGEPFPMWTCGEDCEC